MKFYGYVHSEEGYKSASEGHWPIQLQFSRNLQISGFLKNKVVLFDRALVVDEIFTVSQGSRHENTQWIFWLDSKGFGMGMLKQAKIHYSRPLFRGIFGIFRGGKGTPDHKYGKNYLLNILPSQQARQLCLSKYFQFFSVWEITVLLKIPSLEKM
jgi:hypothetical protein